MYDNNMKVERPNSDENEIKFCSECGCEDFIEVNIQYEFHHKSEYLLKCKNCGHIVNEWCYGFFRNEKNEKYLKEEKRRERKNKIERLNGMVKREL